MSTRTSGPSAAVRIRVMKRDRFRCTYCGRPGTDVELEVDHIIAVANGGSHHMSNLTTACRPCNQKKGAKRLTPEGTLASDVPVSFSSAGSSLLGMYFHIYENDRLNLQGQIVQIDGDTIFGQLFSWMTGEPTEIRTFQKEFIYSSRRCKLYGTQKKWIHAAERQQAFEREYASLRPLPWASLAAEYGKP